MQDKAPPEDPLGPEERRQRYAPTLNAYETLMRFQWAAPERLSDHQEKNCAALARHAIETVPFYRDRLSALSGGGDGIDLKRWLEVPVLTRAELSADGEALVSQILPPEHGKTRRARSSGTTGGPVEVLRSELQDSINACLQFRSWHDRGIDWSHNMGIIRAVDPNAADPNAAGTGPGNSELSKWGPPWLPFAERGDRDIISVHNPPDRQLDWVEEKRPVYVNTMPSNLLALAHHVRDTGRAIDGLAGALTGGDTLDRDIRKEVARWLGIDMYDALSSGECGRIAAECPDREPGYHIEAEAAVVEVLHEDGTPCRPGETGLLTVTPLYGFAMPLIRYRMNDWATMGEPCRCGRGLPVIAEIVGRDRTLVRFADGVRVRLEPDSERVYGMLGPRRWQIVQTAPDRFEVRIADMRVDQPADHDAMAAYVRDLVGRDVQVECKTVAVLGAAPSGKFDRVVREFE